MESRTTLITGMMGIGKHNSADEKEPDYYVKQNIHKQSKYLSGLSQRFF